MTPAPLADVLTLLGYTLTLASAVIGALVTLIGFLDWSAARARARRRMGYGRPRL